MYTYPELETVKRSSIDYEHVYKEQARIETSEIQNVNGYISEDGFYKVSDQWEAHVNKIIKSKNDLFLTMAPIYGVNTEGKVGIIAETKVHTFDTYKEASIARRMAINQPRDFMNSPIYYPKQ